MKKKKGLFHLDIPSEEKTNKLNVEKSVSTTLSS